MSEVCWKDTVDRGTIQMRLLTKAEACRELEMSLSTLDRRIAAGMLMVRREAHGQRHRVYVVMDDDGFKANGAGNGLTDAGVGNSHLAVARERIRGLEELVEVLKGELRTTQEWNAELLAGSNADARETSTTRRRRYKWWRFWARGR